MKSVEVFNLIARKEVDPNILGLIMGESGCKVYAVTDKQYNWLVGVLCKEFKNFDGSISITFEDDEFCYSVNPKYKTNNVPRYIPNNKQYGTTHYIVKSEKINSARSGNFPS